MHTHQLIDIIKKPSGITQEQLLELEVILKEYPFFESAHLLYAKGLHQHNSINYNKQLRKTAIVANSRKILYDLIHLKQKNEEEVVINKPEKSDISKQEIRKEKEEAGETITPSLNPVTVTNNDIKVIYISTPISYKDEKELATSRNSINSEQKEPIAEEITKEISSDPELNIIKDIENETEAWETTITDIETKLNKEIELEISKGIVQSYVETDIIKTPELDKEEHKEPVSFTDWLNKVKKEAGSIQLNTKGPDSLKEPEKQKTEEKNTIKDQKTSKINQNRQIIDKIIEADPGRIKLGNTKFFTPNTEAKQSLLENEHLVTETLAKIYALQGNISKAIRAYEILSLKFPQKSVYFASLIEKLKTNK